MADSVKSIFKILIKVPIIILVCFGIFNIFAFGLCYFKMIGLSYIAMQAAIENNYITPEDRATLESYMTKTVEDGGIRTDVLTDISFSDITTFDRKQYGKPVNVGVKARYNFIWPLTHKEQTVSGVTGFGNGSGIVDAHGNPIFEGWKTDAQLEALRHDKMAAAKTNINIDYVVPGLKYYPDLE